MIKRFTHSCAVLGLAFSAGSSMAAPASDLASTQDAVRESIAAESAARPEKPNLTKTDAMVALDYQIIPVTGGKSIDLMGFHILKKVNDWAYLGVGGHAPLLKGEYGGFMVFDVTAHVQRKIVGNLFANAGVSLGGGGGGKSVQQSRILSGTGGFRKAYIGLGHDFIDYSVGLNLAKMSFTDSAINHSQANIFVQIPFSYTTGSYASSGQGFSSTNKPSVDGGIAGASESILTLGLDNLLQINPEGTNKGTINNVDFQFSYFMTENSYWYFSAGGGYRGRPLYNQALGGIGYRSRVSPRVRLYSQLALGSGGYAPELINTGPGLLVYPKLSAEYLIDKKLGLSLSAGYLYAPKGSSKNYTIGASLNYHIQSGDRTSGPGGSASSGDYSGYRFNLFQQTELGVKYRGADQGNVKMLTMQIDKMISDHVYLPLQVSVAYNPYLTYPGYGEVGFGVGLQSKYEKSDRFQFFGQLLLGANVHSPILKTGIGLTYGLSDQLAIHGVAGQTFAVLDSNKGNFRAEYLGLGLTYRFSVPSW